MISNRIRSIPRAAGKARPRSPTEAILTTGDQSSNVRVFLGSSGTHDSRAGAQPGACAVALGPLVETVPEVSHDRSFPDDGLSLQKLDPLEKGDGGRPVAQFGHAERRRLQGREGSKTLGRRHPRPQRILIALAVGNDLLALLAHDEGQEALGVGLVLTRFEDGGADTFRM